MKVFQVKNYVLLLISFNVVWGIYGTMGAVISSFTGKYGFGPSENTLFSVGFVLFGIVGSFFVGQYLDKSKKFR